MAESGQQGDLRDRFLQVAYDLGASSPVSLVNIQDVGRELGLPADRATLRDHTSEIKRLAYYWGNKGCLVSQAEGFNYFTVTPAGMDEAEGKNRPPEPAVSNVFNIEHAQGSVIGTHNNAELHNTFDFRSIEQRIEQEGGDDKEELRRALACVEQLIERGDYLDRGALSEFSGAMERHSWFTGSVMQALLGFATQASGG